MKIFFIATVLSIVGQTSLAGDLIRISVVDTGFSPRPRMASPHFCSRGHRDLTSSRTPENQVPRDTDGHGSHIIYTIAEQLKKINNDKYCFIVIKYYEPKISAEENVDRSARAYSISIDEKADIINYSSSGAASAEKERLVVLSALERGIKIVTAAGNGLNNKGQVAAYIAVPGDEMPLALGIPVTETYPGGYDSRVVVVGNLNKDGSRHEMSNYGSRVDAWEIGTNIKQGGLVLSGTSQATAVHTGKMVADIINGRN